MDLQRAKAAEAEADARMGALTAEYENWCRANHLAELGQSPDELLHFVSAIALPYLRGMVERLDAAGAVRDAAEEARIAAAVPTIRLSYTINGAKFRRGYSRGMWRSAIARARSLRSNGIEVRITRR